MVPAVEKMLTDKGVLQTKGTGTETAPKVAENTAPTVTTVAPAPEVNATADKPTTRNSQASQFTASNGVTYYLHSDGKYYDNPQGSNAPGFYTPQSECSKNGTCNTGGGSNYYVPQQQQQRGGLFQRWNGR